MRALYHVSLTHGNNRIYEMRADMEKKINITYKRRSKRFLLLFCACITLLSGLPVKISAGEAGQPRDINKKMNSSAVCSSNSDHQPQDIKKKMKPAAGVLAVDEQENIALAAGIKYKKYTRKNKNLWKKNFIKWELYDSETLIKPSDKMNISYTLYVPADYFKEAGSGLSIVHGVELVDEKKQWKGSVTNRGQSWFEPTCDGNGGLSMLRWDMAADEQAAVNYAKCKKSGNYFVIKVKNAPLSSCINYGLPQFVSRYKNAYIIPTVRVYGINVSGEIRIMLDDITVTSGKKILFKTDCQCIGENDGTLYNGITDKKIPIEIEVVW